MSRKLVVLLFALVSFARPSPSHAATVDITVALVTGTNQWTLSLQSLTDVGGIMLEISNSLGVFTPILPIPPVICTLACQGLGEPNQPFSLTLPAPGGPPPFLPLPNGALGYFSATTSSASEIIVLPGDRIFGMTAIDTTGAPILDYAIHVIPEPSVAGLLCAALIAGSRLRRRARNRDRRLSHKG
jgi:hypothetical protein